MNRRLKKLGVVLVAAFAMSIVAASAAQAANFTATNGVYPVSVSGGQTTEHKFTAGIRTVTCKTANFTGSASAASATQTITPEYKECTATGGLPVTVTQNGCDYLFHANSGGATGTVDVVCGASPIVVDIFGSAAAHSEGKAPVCEISIGSQSGLTGITYTNEGAGTSTKVKVEANAKPAISIKGSALVCGTGTTSTYTGTTTVGGTGEGVDVG